MAARFTVVFAGLFAVFQVTAGEPLYVKNLSPVAGLFGLPSQRAAAIGDAGTWQWALHGSVASHYVEDQQGIERLNFDGETQRLALEARYVLAENWELQLELPYLRQDGGFTDSAIDGWHHFWGLPDNGRSDVPQDLLDYRYADPDLRFALGRESSGIGDTSVSLQHSLYRNAGLEVAGSVGYKFGTGDFDDFTGSGEGDAFATLRASADAIGSLPLGWHAQVGYLYAGEVAELGRRQKRNLWFAGGSLEWQLTPSLSLLGQVDTHAAPMDSALDGLGSEAVMLSGGARWQFSEHWAMELSVVEDIAVETAPDVMFQASVRYQPR